MTGLLFDILEEVAPDISGLTYMPDFITRDEESVLIAAIDAQPWLNDLKRRVQHYGYKYDYKARAVNKGAYEGIQTHRSYWVNKAHVEKIVGKSPERNIRTKQGYLIPISRRQYGSVKKSLA